MVDKSSSDLGTGKVYTFLMGAVPKKTTIEVTMFQWGDLKFYGPCFAAVVFSMLLSTCCVLETSNAVINPLRQLNMRMTEILQDESLEVVSLDNHSTDRCREIKSLQDHFSALISDYKFTQNAFMKQDSDVIALIDLAESCVLFSGQNFKAVGVCYNNIANLHYKHQKYQLAANSFNKAVHMAYVCLGQMTPEEFYEKFPSEKPAGEIKQKGSMIDDKGRPELKRYFMTVKAHRYYQFAMCMYKIWRYKHGDDLIEREQN